MVWAELKATLMICLLWEHIALARRFRQILCPGRNSQVPERKRPLFHVAQHPFPFELNLLRRCQRTTCCMLERKWQQKIKMRVRPSSHKQGGSNSELYHSRLQVGAHSNECSNEQNQKTKQRKQDAQKNGSSLLLPLTCYVLAWFLMGDSSIWACTSSLKWYSLDTDVSSQVQFVRGRGREPQSCTINAGAKNLQSTIWNKDSVQFFQIRNFS